MAATIQETTNMLPRIALIACGSFSPPTPMHLRMFEIARDYFEMQGTHVVIGGIVSPTHDSYGKAGLAPGSHRCSMVKLAVKTSSWIRLSDWEIKQSEWSRTQKVLRYHQNYMNNYINTTVLEEKHCVLPEWVPFGLRDRLDRVQLKLLCGADLLESFAVPGLWANEDIEDIVANHGLVVITRCGSNPEKFIFESDILTKYQRNITLITNWVPNEVSSSMVRRLLNRGQSVKYLLDDYVLEYIKLYGLFNCKSKYLTDPMRLEQNNSNDIYINKLSNNQQRTPTSDTDDDDVDETSLNEEDMDETDYSIKNVMTSINLENRQPTNVFCCGEISKVAQVSTKLVGQRSRPGQAVQVITVERGGVKTERKNDNNESEAKKVKISKVHMV